MNSKFVVSGKSTQKELVGLINGFKNLTALIIGDVMLDSYLWGRVDRISPEAPVPVVNLKKRENRLGGAANVALNIQSLGATPLICSVIGVDEKGAQMLKLFQEHDMSVEGLVKSSNRTTTVKFRIMGNNTQLLRVDEESEHNIDPTEAKELFERISNIIKDRKVDVVIFEDYDKGVITQQLISEVVALATEHKIPTVVDPKRKNFLHYKGVSIFKPNLKELREGLKLDNDLVSPEKLDRAVSILQQKLEAEMILATMSDKGIYFYQKCKNGNVQKGQYPAQLRKISDVSGAGDTVVSIAALSLAAGATLPQIAWLANLAGGLVCEQAGVVPINKELLISEVNSQKPQ